MTDFSTQQQLRSKLLAPYRAPRNTPRPDVHPRDVYSDPAPPWVATIIDALIDRIQERANAYRIIAMILDWCSLGEPVSRAERVLMLVRAWPGNPDAVLDMFVNACMDTKAGRPTGCKPKHVKSVRVFESWAEEDAMRKSDSRVSGVNLMNDPSAHVSQ